MTRMTETTAADSTPTRSAQPLPRRVLHVMNGAAGGAALSTIDLMNAMRAHGISSAAVCHDAGSETERRRLTEAVEGRVAFVPLYWWNRKIRAAAWKRPLLELRQLFATGFLRGSSRRVAEAAEHWNCDLVHTNTLMTPEGAAAAKNLNLPHVWHVRELIGPGMPFRLRREGRRLGRYLRESASLVVANSHATAATLADAELGDRLRIVPNGIEAARFSTARRPLGPNDGTIIVGMVGNLTSRWKKQSVFLQAASAVTAANVSFRIYGHRPEGEEYAALEAKIAASGLAGRLQLVGFVDDPVRIMSELDILAHTADQESFGRILAEAMAAGLPVVAVRGGGAAEIVVHEETGLLASPDDAQDMARCIDRLAADGALRAAFGVAGRRRAERLYDLERCVRDMLAVYAEAYRNPLSRLRRSDR